MSDETLIICLRVQGQGGDYPRPIRNMFTEAADALEVQAKRIAELEARLEIDHWFRMVGDELVREEIPPEQRSTMPDGIAARDETIRLLEEQLAKLKERT